MKSSASTFQDTASSLTCHMREVSLQKAYYWIPNLKEHLEYNGFISLSHPWSVTHSPSNSPGWKRVHHWTW